LNGPACGRGGRGKGLIVGYIEQFQIGGTTWAKNYGKMVYFSGKMM